MPSTSTELDTFICTRVRLSNVTLSSIPRSKDVSADCFAKEARGLGVCISNVSTQVPMWLAPHASLIKPA